MKSIEWFSGRTFLESMFVIGDMDTAAKDEQKKGLKEIWRFQTFRFCSQDP